jgi:hypothetical protein
MTLSLFPPEWMVNILLMDIILSGDMQAGIEFAKHAVKRSSASK